MSQFGRGSRSIPDADIGHLETLDHPHSRVVVIHPTVGIILDAMVSSKCDGWPGRPIPASWRWGTSSALTFASEQEAWNFMSPSKREIYWTARVDADQMWTSKGYCRYLASPQAMLDAGLERHMGRVAEAAIHPQSPSPH
jgi:hypothetical protein